LDLFKRQGLIQLKPFIPSADDCGLQEIYYDTGKQKQFINYGKDKTVWEKPS
jgi:hypothetical protein